ncbi:osmotically-inducible lipoprotein OsmE [Pseudomonas qingdaonensis]|uniref:osmotically-inducible lipoprotein OsmE n=1 Tax=Pseudomonas qingdaonensis TaxID=2056231 RepID=UPI00242AA4F0|nr:osmotically-inducible lipoprotein OsmE [Pseudomonas qingdaonensis]
MYKHALAALLTSATLVGCGSNRPENPVDYVTYREQPLVKQVGNGMTMQQVIAIGGSPSSVIDLPHGGTCNNYVLNHEGKQQAYYVRFDATGHVDAKGFKTCEQRQKDEQALPGA